jgi:hypothetical protein
VRGVTRLRYQAEERWPLTAEQEFDRLEEKLSFGHRLVKDRHPPNDSQGEGFPRPTTANPEE